MKKLFFVFCIVFVFTNTGCDKESNYGEAVLNFHGMKEDLKVYIYPIELFSDNILDLKPLMKLEVDSENRVFIKKALPGDYFWWDRGSKKGVFQIIENEKLEFDYYSWEL